MNDGWIRLHRKLIKKGYYKDSEHVHLWIHILLKANHEDTEFLFNGQIINIKRGQFITGRDVLSKETGINRSKIERILKCLKSEQQIEQQTTNKFRLITINNYHKYQTREQQIEQQVSNKRATSEHKQELKNEKNINISNLKNSNPYRKQLHDGSFAVNKFGVWVDANDPSVKIDPAYYPEITKN
jgi:hypothetical protein